MSGLRLGLTIYESDPEPSRQAASGSDLLTRQLWIGAATNRKTRTMMEQPRRWLSLVEPIGRLPHIRDGVLHHWDLEQIFPGDHPSPPNAGGLIISAMDVDACAEEEFNDWYNTEHMPVLSTLPGMLAARRFRAHHGRPSYIALYHVSELSIYAKPSWTAVNETAWTKRMRRYQHNRTYFMFARAEKATASAK
jgi:hypothetical protein